MRDHSEDLLRILALESVRQQVLVVGEDLGTVEPYIREALKRYGILSYRLFTSKRIPTGVSQARTSIPAGAGIRQHSRPADACRLLAGPRHRSAPRGRVLPDEASYQEQMRIAPRGKTADAGRDVRRLACCLTGFRGGDGRP